MQSHIMTPLPVVLRRFGDQGDIIALFPSIPYDPNGTTCGSYQRIGQHGAAHYSGVIAESDPVDASDPDAAALLRELESAGYTGPDRLRVYKRESARIRRAFYAQVDLWARQRSTPMGRPVPKA